MKPKRTKLIALLFAAGLFFAAEMYAAKFPAYLTMEGTKIIGCDKAALPANLTIPEGVTEIGEYAFTDCASLESVTIPASVKSIEEGAFSGHNNLTVRYKGTLAQWCEMDRDLFFGWNAKSIAMSGVADLKAMTALAIPKGVSKIGQYAFYACTSLESVEIPASVKSIEEGAFSMCTSLVSVPIPDGVTEIGDHAFSGCTSLAIVPIPDGVTEIGDYAFWGCTSLASMTIPASVTKIGYGAFLDCKSLTSMTIPAIVRESWGVDIFKNCESLKEVNFLGTIAQWRELYAYLRHVVVHCKDGDYVDR